MSSKYQANDSEFNEWQNKIKRRYNDFRISVDQLKDSPTRISYIDIFDKNININDLEDQIENKDAIDIILQDIKYLEKDLKSVTLMLSIPKFKENPRVLKMIQKLENVKKAISSMKDRALSIRNQYEDL